MIIVIICQIMSMGKYVYICSIYMFYSTLKFAIFPVVGSIDCFLLPSMLKNENKPNKTWAGSCCCILIEQRKESGENILINWHFR